MELWQAIVLGFIQGITEFLPVSSSGHLVITQSILKIPEDVVISFDIIVHLGTLIAVVAYFFQDLKKLITGLFKQEKESVNLFLCLILGTLPVCFVYVVANKYIQGLFFNPQITAFFLVITGFILLLSDGLSGDVSLDKLTPKDSLWIGLGQAIAIMPGISRSGSTIAAGLWRKLSRQAAARVSFLLAIPVILGAGIVDFGNLLNGGYQKIGAVSFWLGLVTSAITGYIVIKFFLSYLQKGTLKVFAFYCMIAGGFAFMTFLL